MEKANEKKGLSISAKSFVTALIVIFVLMVVSYVLTFVIPGGRYDRITAEDGSVIINPNVFNSVEGGIPFWKWILSPFLVLGEDGSFTIIAIIIFLLVIGGVFTCLDRSGLMKYMLDKIVNKFGKSRYKLMAVIMLFFMLMGAMVGSYEECVPLVPIVIALSVKLGWNRIAGLMMSILAVGCGFATGVCNPFTVGVAQELAGLPMFSGVWIRILSFVLIYALLFLFVFLYAKKTERPVETEMEQEEFVSNKKQDRALWSFIGIIGVGILVVLSSAFIPFLQDLNMIIVAVMFLVAGIVSPFLCGMKGKDYLKAFANGTVAILPAVLMILMASSIRFTLEQANVLDTILYGAVGFAGGLPRWVVILFIYLVVLVMNFFIASGSAKAFMLIPLIMPLAQVFGISPQLCILAFAFGDGFSNVFYPTNPVLLISLGVAGVGYGKWVKSVWKFQLINLVLTCGILLLGFVVGY